MSGAAQNVVDFFRVRRPARDWDSNELAQFYRVEAALRQAGVFIETERGVTDEGDPWFVFCRQENGDVFLHVARMDGHYIAASPSMAKTIWRRSFDELMNELVRENPIIVAPQNRKPNSQLYVHPSTLLIAAVAALFYKSASLRAEEHGDSPWRQSDMRSSQGPGILSDAYSVALASALAIIAVLHHSNAVETAGENDHLDDLAFLDGFLSNISDHQPLSTFEGNRTTGLTDGAADAQGFQPIFEHVVEYSGDVVAAPGEVGADQLLGDVLAVDLAVTQMSVSSEVADNAEAMALAATQEQSQTVATAAATSQSASGSPVVASQDQPTVEQIDVASGNSPSASAPSGSAAAPLPSGGAVPLLPAAGAAVMTPPVSGGQTSGTATPPAPAPADSSADPFYYTVMVNGLLVLLDEPPPQADDVPPPASVIALVPLDADDGLLAVA